MKLFCPITSFESKVTTRGRGVGEKISTRLVIAVDSWNWVIGIQRDEEKGPITGQSFHGNISLLLLWLLRNRKDTDQILRTLVKTLVDRTGKAFELPASVTDYEGVGKKIDDVFGTSYMREHPPQVIPRLFGETDAGD
jgi:hypothetical protein